jgi:hypothetical protein
MPNASPDPEAAKREASALWLGRVAGVMAVGIGQDSDGNIAIVVSFLDDGTGVPDLPDRFEGLPVILRPLGDRIRPISSDDGRT